MDKRTEFNTVMKEALKGGDKMTLDTVRLMISEMKKRDVEARGGGRPEGINDTEILSMLQSMVKQRQESLKIYRDAGRNDLADKEEGEIKVIERFLPQQMSDDEAKTAIDGLIKETGAAGVRDMGKVMAELKTRYAGQIDMAKAGGLVKDRLSA
jgi:uncharacterized protein YqeY